MTKAEKMKLFGFYYDLEKMSEGIPSNSQYEYVSISLKGGAISVEQLIDKFGLMSEYYRYEAKRKEQEKENGSSDSQDE